MKRIVFLKINDLPSFLNELTQAGYDYHCNPMKRSAEVTVKNWKELDPLIKKMDKKIYFPDGINYDII